MSLAHQIEEAKRDIVTDGYEMSVGEIVNLYSDEELVVNPAYQRLFRWDLTKKTRFIESMLLGIPIPPIFVFQREDGIWELVDGLQRLSTILQFVGVLRKDDGSPVPKLVLEGTTYLPDLADKVWASDEDDQEAFDRSLQLDFKRARMRVEILKKGSDPIAKFELFNRLNTGGEILSEQEVRTSVIAMLDESFYEWLIRLTSYEPFVSTTSLTEAKRNQQFDVELILRYLAFRNVEYPGRLDVHEYLDAATRKMVTSESFDRDLEAERLKTTFDFLNSALGENAFKKWDGESFSGAFSISAYEVIVAGLAQNQDRLATMPLEERRAFISDSVKRIWSDETFLRNSGGGVRGTSRLANLLPIAGTFFEE